MSKLRQDSASAMSQMCGARGFELQILQLMRNQVDAVMRQVWVGRICKRQVLQQLRPPADSDSITSARLSHEEYLPAK